VRPDITESLDITNTVWITTSTPEPVDDEPNTSKAPTAAGMAKPTVQAVAGAVWVEWETYYELDTFRFHVYRGESDRLDQATPIGYLDGAGHGYTDGRRYSYVDTTVAPSSTYYYWVVEEDTVGRRTPYGPVKATTLPEMPYRAYLSIVQTPLAAGVTSEPDD
jgi:hypothetical protein